jgi:GntR family transcriptional regulator, transcriptional repressor for pyruvate dehydrogenase complex
MRIEPPVRDLAQQLGVSRNVLREALRSLEMAGVLRLRKGVKGGAFIREGDTGRMNVVMRDMLSLGTISVRTVAPRRRGASQLSTIARFCSVKLRRLERPSCGATSRGPQSPPEIAPDIDQSTATAVSIPVLG